MKQRCLHQGAKREEWKTFKNGTRHIALYCKKCGTHQGYRKQRPMDHAELYTVSFDELEDIQGEGLELFPKTVLKRGNEIQRLVFRG